MAQPFLKWAGGKRWLVDRPEFEIPIFDGRYLEPFLGGGAVFFEVAPDTAVLSDLNPRLIETYCAIRDEHQAVEDLLLHHHALHNKEYYYAMRATAMGSRAHRAAQFLYLNRTCWNGLYRENLRGEFNVPIGTKSKVFDPFEDFASIATALAGADLRCCDFEETIEYASQGDMLFVDPPYTTAHNFNGFVKYNENVFSWGDQIRLRDALVRARSRGAKVVATNAFHPSVIDLYDDVATVTEISRRSVISGKIAGRGATSECLIWM